MRNHRCNQHLVVGKEVHEMLHQLAKAFEIIIAGVHDGLGVGFLHRSGLGMDMDTGKDAAVSLKWLT